MTENLTNISELDDLFFSEKKGKIYRILVDSLERPLFDRVLKFTRGNKVQAAKVLGINRNTLRSKLKKLGMLPVDGSNAK